MGNNENWFFDDQISMFYMVRRMLFNNAQPSLGCLVDYHTNPKIVITPYSYEKKSTKIVTY